MKTIGIIYRILHYVPVISVATSLAYLMKATISLGHLPAYNQPDPKALGFDVFHNLNMKLYLASCVVILPIGLCDCIPKIRQAFQVSKADIIIFTISAFAFLYLYFISFFGEWIFD